jgi:radical SAM superfamily enzyme YgiQ (UPF0313 family)
MTTALNLNPHSRILLIEPPFYRFFGYERWNYPITLTLLATYLEELGHYVRVYDADKPTNDCRSMNRVDVRNNYYKYNEGLSNSEHLIWKEVRDTIKEFRPDVVGITSVSAKIDSADKIAAMVKQEYRGSVTTILGGPHIQGMRTMNPDYFFGADYDQVVTMIPNLINRKPKKELILNYNTYSPANLSSILASTGCPNSCTFCCNSFEKTMIYKDYNFLKEEIEEIRNNYPSDTVVDVGDDCLFSNTRYFDKLTSLLHDNGLQFTAASRIMALTPEKIKTFMERGGKRILVGIESGSQGILDRIKKRLTIEQVIERVSWLNDAGIPWTSFFVIGFPFETLADIKLTKELIYKVRPTFASLNRFVPYPGTEIYQEFYSESNIRFRDLFQLNPVSCVKLDSEIEEYIDNMFDELDRYNRENAK